MLTLTTEIKLPTVPVTRAWLSLPLALVSALSCFSIALYGLGCIDSRFVADDWMFRHQAHLHGILGASHWVYITTGGRFASNMLNCALCTWGDWTGVVLALVLFLAWGASIVVLARSLATLLRLEMTAPVFAGGLACFGAAVVYGLPSVGQSFYWITGATTYTLPVVIATTVLAGAVALAANDAPLATGRAIVLACVAALAGFFASGCSEIGAVAQGGTYLVALICGILLLKGRQRGWFCLVMTAALIGAVGGLLLDARAPGNIARQGEFGHPRTLAYAFHRSWLSSSRYYESWIHDSCVALGCMLGACGALCKTSRLVLWRLAVFTVVSTILCRFLIAGIMLPTGYVSGTAPPMRATISMFFVLYAWAAALGFGWGLYLAQVARSWPRKAKAAALVGGAAVLLWVGLPAGFQYYSQATAVFCRGRDFVRQWSARDSAPVGSHARYITLAPWFEHDYVDNLRDRDHDQSLASNKKVIS